MMGEELYTKDDLPGLLKTKGDLTSRLHDIEGHLIALSLAPKNRRGNEEERIRLGKEKLSIQKSLSANKASLRQVTYSTRKPNGHQEGWVTLPELNEKIDRLEALLEGLVGRIDAWFEGMVEKPGEEE